MYQSVTWGIHLECIDLPEYRSATKCMKKKGKKKVHGVPQSQTAALPRHQEEEKTDKTEQAQSKQTYEKH